VIVSIEKPPKRIAVTRNPSLVHRFQCQVWLLGNQSEDTRCVPLQWRTPARTRFWRGTPELQPFDCRAGASFKAIGRPTPQRTGLDCFGHPLSQVTRRLFHSEALGNPDSNLPGNALIDSRALLKG
jgi:hypothetical protein